MADPEPHDRIATEQCQGPPLDADPDGVDRISRMNAFEL
jgi:hypothetical protein